MTGAIAFTVETAIAKVDSERRIAYGIVLEPRTSANPDAQGDWYTVDDIEEAFHAFHEEIAKGSSGGDLMHDGTSEVGHPHDSFLAPIEFQLGGQIVKAGSWVMGMHYPDDAIWKRVVAGELAAFSVAGVGKRIFEGA